MKKIDWFEMWFADKQSIVETMVRNMVADLDAGYDYFGKSITEQREAIAEYQANFDNEVNKLKEMDEGKANRWCYIDMKKRGAIS